MKCMWMCAEKAVLTMTEFFYCQWLYDTQPHARALLEKRNTLLFKRTSDLRDKTRQQTAARIDELMHGIAKQYLEAKTDEERNKVLPEWVRENLYGKIFCADYIPMLEEDRKNIDHNWNLLMGMTDEEKNLLRQLPNQRYNHKLNGLELTVSMIADFDHILEFSGEEVDESLRNFNQERRQKLKMPLSWNKPQTK